MPRIFNLVLVLLFCFSIHPALARDLTYCVAVDRIDYNPFRYVHNGQELAYLMLLRSYISTNPSEPGLLKAYEFSPDGRTSTGQMIDGLKWSDGSDVKLLDLINGIVKALPYRPLGNRVKVLGFSELDERTFRINFESSIENLTGVVREALSTNSRHNRFWPIKSGKHNGHVFVLGKFPQSLVNRFRIFDNFVKVVPASNCLNADMSLTAELLGTHLEKYSTNQSPTASAIFLQLNTVSLQVDQRARLYHRVKLTFARLAEANSLKIVDKIFLPGESGFKAETSWSSVNAHKASAASNVTIGYGQPIYRNLLMQAHWGPDFKVRLVQLPSKENLDAQILPAGMEKGRHLILQDILNWPHSRNMLARAPQTLAKLAEISVRSASTIPPDDHLLSEFETAAIREVSFAPLARRSPIAYTQLTSPLVLRFTPEGELTFAVSKP